MLQHPSQSLPQIIQIQAPQQQLQQQQQAQPQYQQLQHSTYVTQSQPQFMQIQPPQQIIHSVMPPGFQQAQITQINKQQLVPVPQQSFIQNISPQQNQPQFQFQQSQLSSQQQQFIPSLQQLKKSNVNQIDTPSKVSINKAFNSSSQAQQVQQDHIVDVNNLKKQLRESEERCLMQQRLHNNAQEQILYQEQKVFELSQQIDQLTKQTAQLVNEYEQKDAQIFDQQQAIQQLEDAAERARMLERGENQMRKSQIQESSQNEAQLKQQREKCMELEGQLLQARQEKLELTQTMTRLKEQMKENENFRSESAFYEARLEELDSKTVSLLEQNKQVIEINDSLMKEVGAFRQMNQQLTQAHVQQIEELRAMWQSEVDAKLHSLTQQFESEKQTLNKQKQEHSVHMQNRLAEHQEMNSCYQSDLAHTQQVLSQTEQELQQTQINANELQNKLAELMQGNENLMSVIDQDKADLTSWQQRYQQAVSSSSQEIQQLQTSHFKQCELMQQRTESDLLTIQQLQGKNTILQQDCAKFKDERDSLAHTCADQRTRMLEMQREREGLILQATQVNELNLHKKELSSNLLLQQDKLEDSQEKMRRLLQENQELNRALNARLSELTMWQTRYSSLQASLEDNLRNTQHDHAAQVVQMKEQLQQAQQNTNAMQNKAQQLNDLLHQKNEEMAALHNKLQLVQSEHNSILQQKHNEISSLNSQIVIMQQGQLETQNSIEVLTYQYNDLVTDRQKLAEQVSANQGLLLQQANQITALQEEKKQLVNRIDSINQQLAQRNEQINTLQTEKQELYKQCSQFQQLQMEFAVQKDAILHMESALQRECDQRRRLEEQITIINTDREHQHALNLKDKETLQAQLLQNEDRHRLQLLELRRNLERESQVKLTQQTQQSQDQIKQLKDIISQKDTDVLYLKRSYDQLLRDNDCLIREADEWRHRAVNADITTVRPFDSIGRYYGSGGKNVGQSKYTATSEFDKGRFSSNVRSSYNRISNQIIDEHVGLDNAILGRARGIISQKL